MIPLTDIALRTNDGNPDSIARHAGQVLLIVNTASQCGLTPQYAGLQALHEKYRDQGFAVLGFPANDFAGQEPGSDAQIGAFCRSTYAIDFPLFAKVAVTGPDAHPLFAALTQALPEAQGDGPMRDRLAAHGMTPNPPPGIVWNFEKFVIGRDGQPVARFSPDTAPDDDRLVAAIERELFASEG